MAGDSSEGWEVIRAQMLGRNADQQEKGIIAAGKLIRENRDLSSPASHQIAESLVKALVTASTDPYYETAQAAQSELIETGKDASPGLKQILSEHLDAELERLEKAHATIKSLTGKVLPETLSPEDAKRRQDFGDSETQKQ